MRDGLPLGGPVSVALVRHGGPDVVDGVDVEEREGLEGDGRAVGGEDDVQVTVGGCEWLGGLGASRVEREITRGGER